MKKLILYVKETLDLEWNRRNWENFRTWLTDANGLESTIKNLESENATLQSQVITLQAQNEDFERRIDALENP